MISAGSSQKIAIALLWIAGLFTIAVLIVMIGYIFTKGASMMNPQFLLGFPLGMGEGGILPMIVSTIYVTGLALLVATPLGVGSAIYLAECAKENAVTKAIRFMTETLAGAPAIVIGLFGFAFFILYLRIGFSVLAGGLTLSILALPIIIRTAEEAIKAVPSSYREGSLALGATKWQTTRSVVVPSALPGIATGVMLAMGRTIGEAAAILFVVGGGFRIPESLFSPAQPLVTYMFALFEAGIISADVGYGVATVLLIIVLAITIGTHVLTTHQVKKMEGR